MLAASAVLACGGSAGRETEGADTSGVTPPPATTTGATGETTGGTTAGSPTTGGPEATSTTAPVTSTDGFKLDIGMPDFGDRPPPVMPTCDNLADFGLTSVGCEFWAIDTEVIAFEGGFGIGVGNPWDEPVMVTISDRRGAGGTLRTIGEVQLGARESKIVEVNGTPGALLPGENHAPLGGTTPTAAFRVTSTMPITAMQINPVGGAASFVPDASMLLPTGSLSTSYYALGYGGAVTGNVLVIATQDGTTVTTTQGATVLNAFDALRVDLPDVTGFFVGADAPVAVFSGAVCANVPLGQGWCDHIEEQLFPLAAWGTRYVGARHPQRVPDMHPAPEDVYWRVIAATDGTVITFTPPVPGLGASIELGAGISAEFASPASFLAESDADHPFMLVQYMAGGTSVGNCAGPADGIPVGDPYMLQMVPIAQWLTQLPFLTDTSYVRDFVWITREAGTTVELACLGQIPDDHFVAVEGTNYEVGAVDLDIAGAGGEGQCGDGQQFITASAPVGVSVGGIDCAASYAYPGGLSLDALWVPPDKPPG